MEKGNYYVGLDVGTDSVGWAVTDENYCLVKSHGKSLWGIRLFDGANTAQERRLKRTGRRREERRRQRIKLLQEIFDTEIAKVDENFFARLEESKFFPEDKKISQSRYGLFADENYTDMDYFKEYPTIYHLRKALMFDETPHDIRLVYLAIHNIVKHRGHFLFEGDLKDATEFGSIFEHFLNYINDEMEQNIGNVDIAKAEALLCDKNGNRSSRKRELQSLFGIEKDNKAMQAVLGLMVGLKGDLKVLFPENVNLADMEKTSFSFADASYEEFRADLEEKAPESICLIDMIKSVYDWTILTEILQGGECEGQRYLSVAKTKLYEKHKEDLCLLKHIIKEYIPGEYKRVFYPCKDEKNYAAYIGEKGLKRCTREEFYKFLNSIFKNLPENEEIVRIKDAVEKDTFLPLLITKDNGVIPYQVHKAELERILDKAESYLPFLREQTKEGLTNREKIEKLFEFRIPYYVGPLNDSHKDKNGNCWIVRKDAGSIRPWNFEEKVDLDASAEKFIGRMTAKCSYLAGEDVLPENSLLYSEFMVLNELNNLKIKGSKLPVALKSKIYKEVFQKHTRVTVKLLLEYLKTEGYEVTREDLSGFDKDFKSSLTSYLDFQKKVFKGEEEKMELYATRQMVEKIIRWICVYGDEKRMLKRVIKREYGSVLSDAQIRTICNLKYTGWGRLSAMFLQGIEGADCETGEVFSIIGALRGTDDNLMQILSRKYTFLQRIEEINAERQGVITGISYDALIKDMYVSPAIKRSIWQTVLVLQEITGVLGAEPARIFIEMARGEDEKTKKRESGRTDSRKSQLIALYQNIQDESRAWQEELERTPERDFRNIKLYLYYTQKGRCMYSGEPIALKDLADTNIYDRDHIYPQSKTKDDSLNNLVLVKKSINAVKSDNIISPAIQKRMRPFWTELLHKKLISEEKFNRLTRTTPLTEEELAGFIARQLVETRQSTKAIGELLGRLYEHTKIVYVKAQLAADFKRDNNIVKCRILNDYHHAKDAYLNIVAGNVYFTKFTDNPLRWLKENPDRKYSLNQMFSFDLYSGEKCVWKRGKQGTIQTVLNTVKKNNILYTRYALCNKGELFNAQIVGRKENPTVPVKKGMDVKKYGGYKGITPAYFALVESLDKKGHAIRSVEAVPLYLEKEIDKNEEVFLKYCHEEYGLTEPKVLIKKMKKNALIKLNGFPMHLRGTTGKQLSLQGAVQLCMDEEDIAYIKRIENYIERNINRSNKKENILISEKYDKLSKEKNLKLYEKLLKKHEKSIYRLRPASQVRNLQKGEETFTKLCLEEQTICLAEILKLFSCKPVTANLQSIGASAYAGNIAVNKIISSFDSAYLIHQSVTGIYQQEIDLLHI